MGQAKRRGSFEERKAESIASSEFIINEMTKMETEWYGSLTEEERAVIDKQRAKQALILDQSGYSASAKHIIDKIKMRHETTK